MAYNSWDYMNGSLHALEMGQSRQLHQSEMAAMDAQAAARTRESQLDTLIDKAYDQARDLSYLRKTSEEAFKILTRNSTALNVIMSEGFSNLATALSRQQDRLDSIDQALRNPAAIAAAEHFRVGLQLLQNGLLGEARYELYRSLENDGVQPMAWFAYGLAQVASGDSGFDSFQKAYRYSKLDREVSVHNGPERGSLTASALIFAVEQAKAPEEVQWALVTANQETSTEPLNHCAELWLAFARKLHSVGEDSDSALFYALRLAPEYSAIAVYEELPKAREIAEQVYNHPMIQNAIRLEEIRDQLSWGDKSWDEVNERSGTHAVGHLAGKSYRTVREDVRNYEDITYALLRHPGVFSLAMVSAQSFRADIAEDGIYGKNYLQRDRDKLQAIQNELVALGHEEQYLASSTAKKPGMFAKPDVKEAFAASVRGAQARTAAIQRERSELEEESRTITARLPHRETEEQRRLERVRLTHEFLDLYLQAGVQRVKPLQLF